jgi:hypothetical protein
MPLLPLPAWLRRLAARRDAVPTPQLTDHRSQWNWAGVSLTNSPAGATQYRSQHDPFREAEGTAGGAGPGTREPHVPQYASRAPSVGVCVARCGRPGGVLDPGSALLGQALACQPLPFRRKVRDLPALRLAALAVLGSVLVPGPAVATPALARVHLLRHGTPLFSAGSAIRLRYPGARRRTHLKPLRRAGGWTTVGDSVAAPCSPASGVQPTKESLQLSAGSTDTIDLVARPCSAVAVVE